MYGVSHKLFGTALVFKRHFWGEKRAKTSNVKRIF